MIIVRLKGGLGNQLFQFAAGYALAKHLNTQVKVDTYSLKLNNKKFSSELDLFTIDYEVANKSEIRNFIPFPQLYKHFPKIISRISKHVYQEKYFHFDENFFSLHHPLYLDGYWQSLNYFHNIESDIRKMFKVKKVWVEKLKDKQEEIKNKNSVSVHIRRGDFLNPKAISYHGVLPLTYYHNAIEILRNKLPEMQLYFFSDDIAWVKKHMNPPLGSEFISDFTNSPIEDFFLMSCCRHNIIANSSFSWWTAWLNNYEDKIVIAPKNWFANQQILTQDLLPTHWIRT